MTRTIRISVFSVLLVLLCACLVFAADAPRLSVQMDAIEDGQVWSAAKLQDDNWYSKLTFNETGLVEISSDQDIHFLYIVWDRIPGNWLLTEDAQGHTLGQLCGQGNYLHEYVALDAPSTHVTLHMPQAGAILCDVLCYGEGDVPADVQVWQPFYDDADMLLISTHADDEHLFFGGTMPTYAGELGYKVQIAYLTHHWEQPMRPHELLDGLWTVGMTHYPVISTFTDYYSDNLEHAKTLWDLDEVEAYEVMLLRRFKPEVVIDHDINGEYGHGAHRLNTWVLQQAINWAYDASWRADETAAPGSYLEAAQKLEPFQPLKVYLHLWPENAVHMNWDKPLSHFGGRTAFEMAEAGFACHVSQQEYFKVGRRGVFDCAAFGLYYTGVGPDTKLDDPDFFENIAETDFSDYQAAAPEEPDIEPAAESEEAETPEPEKKPETGSSFSRTYLPVLITVLVVVCAAGGIKMKGKNRRKKGKH